MSKTYRILIVDDDTDILNMLRVVIESRGFEVITASSASEGIESARKQTPDLVICDMMMEEIDSGTKVAETIRDMKADIPVFLLSSLGEATARYIDLEKIGFRGYLQKPVKTEVLIDTIENTLGINGSECSYK